MEKTWRQSDAVHADIIREVSEVDRFIEVLEKIVGATHSISRNGATFHSQTNVRKRIVEFRNNRIQRVFPPHAVPLILNKSTSSTT